MASQKTSSSNAPKGNVQSLWKLTAGQRARYTFAIAVMAVGTVCLLSVAFILQQSLDHLASGESDLLNTLVWSALAIVGLNAAHGFFTYLRGRWAAQASENIVRNLRHKLYQHLEHLPCTFHDQADTGDLVQRCSSDVETIRVFLAAQVVEIARVSLFVLVAAPIMFSQDWRMALLSMAVVPVIIIFAVLFFRKVRSLFEKVDQAEGALTTVLQENLVGVRVVRAFRRQEYEIEKLAVSNDKFRDLEYELFGALSRYWTLSDFLVFLQMGLVLIGGGYFALQSHITLGTWALYWWLIRIIIWPVRHIGRVLAESGKAMVAIDRISQILNEQPESIEPVTDQPVAGDIEISHLSFSYDEGPSALNDLSLTIRRGETVALLGPPGAGKSTLVNLLVRLYDYETGEIRIGGDDLKTINRDSVRDAFGMVLQDPFLYSKTVRDNVVIGHGSAAEHEVEESTRAADIHENIIEFENGYETMVGERGVTLSGGQRQRLAIARALLKNPEFLVLDDSLSAVDTQTEAHILRSLTARRGKKTTIIIAHRLSSMRLADRIFVFDQGQLVQKGTHDELLAAAGPYQRLWKIQGDLEDQIEHDLTGVEPQ